MPDWPIDWNPDEYGEFQEIEMDPDLVHRIGLFIVAWSQLEDKLDSLFAILFKLDPTYAITIYAGLSVKAKISIVRSAVEQISEALDEKTNAQIKEILDYISFVSVEWRNNLVHAIYHEGDTFIKITNHTKLKGRFLEPSVEALDEATHEVTDTAREIHALVPKLIEIMAKLTPADFDRLCHF